MRFLHVNRLNSPIALFQNTTLDFIHIRRRALEILDKGDASDPVSVWCDRLITVWVLLNIAAITLESVQSYGVAYAQEFAWFETVSVVFFSVEYALRLWASGARFSADEGGVWRGRRKYALSFHGLVDLAAIAPYYLQFLFPGLDMRILRTLRLLRILKISHYSSALEDLFSAIKAEAHSFYAALYILLITVLLSASLMYFAENSHQPDKFASIPDSLYWAVITLTTVGYGDVSPITPIGKVISVFTAFLGVCTVAMLTGIVASAFSNQMARRKAIFENELRQALADGEISEQEQSQLQSLKDEFNLSDEQVSALMQKITREEERTR
jgi:voltage-gated potassium channel